MSRNQFLYEPIRGSASIWRRFIDVLQGIVIILALMVVCYLFLVIPNQVDGQSMEPNFYDKELLLTNKIIAIVGDKEFMTKYDYNYKRGDVVIFQKPGYEDFIKRVIGIPGDEVAISGGSVYINGTKIIEEYIPSDFATQTYSFMYDGEVKTVPAGEYFLLGDNRNNSRDSRFEDIGFVPRAYIKGRVFLRWWPTDRFGTIKAGNITFDESSTLQQVNLDEYNIIPNFENY